MSDRRGDTARPRRVPGAVAVLVALTALVVGALLGYAGRGGASDPRPTTVEVPLPVVTVTVPAPPSPAPERSTPPPDADRG